MMNITLGELAQHVNGEVIGEPETIIHSAATLESAGSQDISFLSNRKYIKHLGTTGAAAVVVGERFDVPKNFLLADDPYFAFTQIIILLHGHRQHPSFGTTHHASIAATAEIGKNTHIHDFVTIGANARIGGGCVLYPGVFIGPDTSIGKDCIFYPNAVVYDHCRIGNRVIIHANATIGEDGYGFATHEGVHYKIPHIGTVILEDDVEIGSGCAIERGALDETLIGKGTKIGDAVVIGHGTKVGSGCLLVPQVGIAGSTTIGNHCVVAGKAAIGGHLKIGNGVVIGGNSGVVNDIPDGQTIFGFPAFEASQAKRAYLRIRSLPEMYHKLRRLEKQIAVLEKTQQTGETHRDPSATEKD